jgi:hypothetical protein
MSNSRREGCVTSAQERSSAPDARYSALPPPAAFRPGTPTEIAQVIERRRARYLTEVRVLWEELRQHGQALVREPAAELPSEHGPPQATQAPQTENASTGFPDPALPLPPAAAAPPPHTAQAPPPAQPQRRTGAARLGARTVHPFYWVLLGVVFLLLGLGLGVLLAPMLAVW